MFDSDHMKKLVKFYRISDSSQQSAGGAISNKSRPSWFSKRACFINFVTVFGADDLFVVADGCSEATLAFVADHVDHSRIIKTSYGSGAFSFMHAARLVAQLPDKVRIYFSEDDWPVRREAPAILHEGLDIADMVSLADYPDRYVNAGQVSETGCIGNPLISDNSELTRVYLTHSTHWKLSNSACMTFATTAGIVKTDLQVYDKYTRSGYPYDFAMFRELITVHGRKLVSPIPGVGTHAESPYLTPHVDWARVVQETQQY